MKSLWFCLVFLICVVSCRHHHKDKEGSPAEEHENLGFPFFQESDSDYPDEQWQDLDFKENNVSPDVSDSLLWNFNLLSNTNLESEKESKNKNTYGVSEENDENELSPFLREDDKMKLFNERPSLIFENENNDKSSIKYENDDWLLHDYDYFLDKLNKQDEDTNVIDKNVDKNAIQVQSFETEENHDDKLLEGNASDDWSLFPLGNDYGYFSGKSSQKKDDMDSVNNNANIDFFMLSYFKFNQENKDKLPKKKENDDLLLFPFGNDYDHLSDKMSKETKEIDTENKKDDIEITLLTNVDNKITIRIVNKDGSSKIVKPDEADRRKGPMEWDPLSDEKYFDNYEYTDNSDFDDRIQAHRYFDRSSMFMISTVIIVFSVVLFGFCLLCKIFNPKRKAHNKEPAYQPLNEEMP